VDSVALRFTPLDPDHLHAGQVWEDEGGEVSVVLRPYCSASVRGGCSLAKILVRGVERFEGSRYFASRRLVKCVGVDWVEEVVDGQPHMKIVLDHTREWRVVDGVGQTVRGQHVHRED
jgi:hypothetical protein